MVILPSCKNNNTLNEPPTLQEQIISLNKNELKNINREPGEKSPFRITNTLIVYRPTFTYNTVKYTEGILPDDGTVTIPDNPQKDTTDINVSKNISLMIYFSNIHEEKIKTIKINNIKIDTKPKKGTLKLYEINSMAALENMNKVKENEIKDNYEFKLLTLDDKFVIINILAFIEKIKEKDETNLSNIDYKQYIKDIGVTNQDLNFKISFTLQIESQNNIYATYIEYDSNEIDLFSEDSTKVYKYNEPIYFQKLETE